MLSQCSVRYFVEIHELQTELSVLEARGVANFGTRCNHCSLLMPACPELLKYHIVLYEVDADADCQFFLPQSNSYCIIVCQIRLYLVTACMQCSHLSIASNLCDFLRRI